MEDLNNYIWNCNTCGDCMNDQPGFDASSSVWCCKKCHTRYFIDSSSGIVEVQEDELFGYHDADLENDFYDDFYDE